MPAARRRVIRVAFRKQKVLGGSGASITPHLPTTDSRVPTPLPTPADSRLGPWKALESIQADRCTLGSQASHHHNHQPPGLPTMPPRLTNDNLRRSSMAGWRCWRSRLAHHQRDMRGGRPGCLESIMRTHRPRGQAPDGTNMLL